MVVVGISVVAGIRLPPSSPFKIKVSVGFCDSAFGCCTPTVTVLIGVSHQTADGKKAPGRGVCAFAGLAERLHSILFSPEDPCQFCSYKEHICAYFNIE